MKHQGDISAVLDWEFAGSSPLSEAISSTDVDVLEVTSAELEEDSVWGLKIRNLIKEGTKERHWKNEGIELFSGKGGRVVGIARTEMARGF